MKNVTIRLAKSSGFCYGVNRAVRMCYYAARKYNNCVTLGPIIHNKHVINELKSRGVRVAGDVSEITDDNTVIIRSHGVEISQIETLEKSGANIIDATCPDVKKIHDIVRRDCDAGRYIIVIGTREHPEVSAICSRCDNFEVFETPDELLNMLNNSDLSQKPVSIVFQTTGIQVNFNEFVTNVKKVCTNSIIYDTICNATKYRQDEAADISRKSDVMLVIGDEISSNSRKLAEICKKYCDSVYFIEDANDLDSSMFQGKQNIGITAGASTPAFIIKEVLAKMSIETGIHEEEIMDKAEAEQNSEEVIPVASESAPESASESAPEPVSVSESESASGFAPEPVSEPDVISGPESAVPSIDIAADTATDTAADAATDKAETEPAAAPEKVEISDDDTFEEMLEKTIKTLRTGDKVTGIVTSITATEISVDLGAKQSGYIPIDEFTDDENTDINEIIKTGDEIEAFITRVNDVEGMIILSKKRLDAIKNWDVIMAARDSREIVQGTVIQENRGGIVVNVKGVHVFVPASQTGLGKNEPLSDLLKKSVKLRVNEVNPSRRRVIGSIRDAQKDERREKSEKLWNEIEAGKQYNGVVKSMTSYGVFVDIGGVDGMIHISELSWTRIKQPSEILSVGDEISVYVISFDKENKKISLGYKKGDENPWTKFTNDFKAGDETKVKIVKMMPFGAFAEICPGVDGLIHISQIAQHRIGLPSEVLSEGQIVDVKILEIDNDRKKVSLSMKALIEPEDLPETADAEEAPAEESVEETVETPAEAPVEAPAQSETIEESPVAEESTVEPPIETPAEQEPIIETTTEET